MADRRSRSDADVLVDELMDAPWWVSIVVWVVCYPRCRHTEAHTEQ